MSEEHTPSSSRSSDDDLSALLQETLGCEPPRDAFVASLAASLEAEFDAVPACRSTEKGRDPASNRRRHSSRRAAWRRVRRSVAVMALTGVVVIAAAVWTSRPSYSWTSMLRALEAQPWVESAVEREAGHESQGWFSQPHRLVIVRTAGDVVWSDLDDGLRSRYESGSSVLLRERLDDEAPRSVEPSLLSFLLSGIAGTDSDDSTQSSSGQSPVVLSESWRSVGKGANRSVELDVVLSTGAVGSSPVHLLLTLDPDTQLPRKCELLAGEVQIASTVRFEYPDQGPQEVFDVGVPRNVVVQDVTSSEPGTRVASRDLVPQVDVLTRPPDGLASADALRSELDVIEQPVEQPDSPATSLTEVASAEIPSSETINDQFAYEAVQPPALIERSTEEMSRRVDEMMAACWDRNGLTAAAPSDDTEFFRRVSLDLTGRIPTVAESREFSADTGVDRRHRLVEQLLARRDHATHLGAVWRKMLLPDGVDLSMYGGTASFEEWLSVRFRNNVPYDELVRQLLLAEGRVSESGPILFYTALNLKPEELAAQTSRAFLGIRLECAQCHDHFFDKRLKQTDFWGLAAFFAQISQPEGKMERVSPVLRVADTDHGEVKLPDTEDVVGPKYPLDKSLSDDSDDASRRDRLAAWITAADNPHFARATVNRVWAHLFGRGLVDPVDDMRIDNPSICPEVLDELAGYFIATNFDLRDLFRVIVNSQTYQLTSHSIDDDPARALHFAQMNIKSFTAEQLYDSISVATRLEPMESDDGSLMRFANVSRQSFLEQFRAPPGHVTDYQAGIPQALTLMNGGLMQSATDLRSSGILKSLEAPFFTDEQRVNTIFLATLSREPEEAERQEMLDYVLSEAGERQQRLGDVLWVLLNSAEFTLNH